MKGSLLEHTLINTKYIRDTKNPGWRAFSLVTRTIKTKEDSFILVKTIGRRIVCRSYGNPFSLHSPAKSPGLNVSQNKNVFSHLVSLGKEMSVQKIICVACLGIFKCYFYIVSWFYFYMQNMERKYTWGIERYQNEPVILSSTLVKYQANELNSDI